LHLTRTAVNTHTRLTQKAVILWHLVADIAAAFQYNGRDLCCLSY